MSVIFGLVGAWVVIILGMLLKGGSIAGVISPAAFLMVVGGTTCVLIASFGMKKTASMIALTRTSFAQLPDRRPELIHTLVGFSEKARREGLLVLSEAVLSWLGIGVDGSWGQMIDGARNELAREPVVWWNIAAAGLSLFTLILAVNAVGDAVRDVLDPRTRREVA